MPKRNETEARLESIETLVREIEKVSDPASRSLSQQLVQALIDLNGSGFERTFEVIYRAGETGQRIIDELGRDPLVRSLLLLYGIHPLDLRTRILEALDKSRPYLRSHGGNVELVEVTGNGAVTLRLEGTCHTCPSSAVTLQSMVEQAIYEAAPDVTSIIVEGEVKEPQPGAAFVPLAAVSSNASSGNASRPRTAETVPAATHSGDRTEWQDVFDLDSLPAGQLRRKDVAGQSVLFFKLNGDYYAYSVTCPGCGQPLEDGRLENEILACPVCLQRYDLVHAGRGVDVSTLHLEPVPLLKEDGRARVALTSTAQRSAG